MSEGKNWVNTNMDDATLQMLDKICEEDDHNRSQMVRQLIRQEFGRRYSQPNPLITISEAVEAPQPQEA